MNEQIYLYKHVLFQQEVRPFFACQYSVHDYPLPKTSHCPPPPLPMSKSWCCHWIWPSTIQGQRWTDHAEQLSRWILSLWAGWFLVEGSWSGTKSCKMGQYCQQNAFAIFCSSSPLDLGGGGGGGSLATWLAMHQCPKKCWKGVLSDGRTASSTFFLKTRCVFFHRTLAEPCNKILESLIQNAIIGYHSQHHNNSNTSFRP